LSGFNFNEHCEYHKIMSLLENPDIKSGLIAGQTPTVFIFYQDQNTIYLATFLSTLYFTGLYF